MFFNFVFFFWSLILSRSRKKNGTSFFFLSSSFQYWKIFFPSFLVYNPLKRNLLLPTINSSFSRSYSYLSWFKLCSLPSNSCACARDGTYKSIFFHLQKRFPIKCKFLKKGDIFYTKPYFTLECVNQTFPQKKALFQSPDQYKKKNMQCTLSRTL